MKVEFIESELWGAALFVAEADFKLAKTRGTEFDSLAHATTAFANLFDVDYTIARNEYNAALDVLEKNERLSSRLAHHSIQNGDGLKSGYRTTISLNVCFTPMRMGIT